MNRDDFLRWFNRGFWRAFRRWSVPLGIPRKQEERRFLLNRVFDAVQSARYSPSIPQIEIVSNKGYGVVRYVPVFCIEDYCVYFFCIRELEEVLCSKRVENTFGGWTLGGQMPRAEHEEVAGDDPGYGRYSFNPDAWKQAFGQFNALLFSQLQQGRHTHVLQFDLSNFYDSVRLDTLERWIREEAPAEKGWIITLLFFFLSQWNRRNTGLHPQAVGLPMDALADCSRILANYYLQKYDRYAERVCAEFGGVYFRYSDDQMIFLNGTETVETLLLLLTRRLDRYGLRVNQKKTDLWTTGILAQHRFIDIQALFGPKEKKRDPQVVLQFVQRYLNIPSEELAKSWNGGMPLLNRLLYANLESLPPNLFVQILERFTSEKFLIAADFEKLMRIAHLCTRSPTPLDFGSQLDAISKKCVHNAFHYEVIEYARTANNPALVASTEARIVELDGLVAQYE
jgi:hypothetical protein